MRPLVRVILIHFSNIVNMLTTQLLSMMAKYHPRHLVNACLSLTYSLGVGGQWLADRSLILFQDPQKPLLESNRLLDFALPDHGYGPPHLNQ